MSKSALKKEPTPTEKVAVYESLLAMIAESTWNQEKINDYLANISDWDYQRKQYFNGAENYQRMEKSFYNLLKSDH